MNESAMRATSGATLRGWLIVLIAVHSYAVGVVLLILPSWGVGFGGWEAKPPLFFIRQVGVLHFILATAYLYEYLAHRTARLLVFTKACATLFLLAETALESVPWLVPVSAVTDGLMGLAVFVLFRRGGETA
jgi:hypothetical protein